MSEQEIADLRRAATDAWRRGSMAECHHTLVARDLAIVEAWAQGECCGECGAGGSCGNVRLNVARTWQWGYYHPGACTREIGDLCDRTPDGLERINRLITSGLFERICVERMLKLVFRVDGERDWSLFRKAEEMANELIDVDSAERQLMELRTAQNDVLSEIKKGLQQVRMITLARRIVKHHIEELAELQGSPLGFMTDRKDGKRYSSTELLDPLTEAMVRGLPLTGNCINIIAGRCYVTIEGWQHLISRNTDFQCVKVSIGAVDVIRESEWIQIPKDAQAAAGGRTSRAVPGMAKVEATVECVYRGHEIRIEFRDRSKEPGEIDGRIAIRVNHGMGEDAVQGKARRRLLKALYVRCMGQADSVEEDDDGVIEGSYAATTDPAPSPPVAAIEATQPAPPTSSNAERITKMLDAFAGLGVTVPMIRDRLKVDDLATIGEQELSLLGTVYKAMKDKGRTWAETE